MVDNDLSKSVKSIVKDIGGSDFLIREVVHEDIPSFLCKMKKGQFLLQIMKDKRKDRAEKLLKKLKHLLQPNILCFFSN